MVYFDKLIKCDNSLYKLVQLTAIIVREITQVSLACNYRKIYYNVSIKKMFKFIC